MITELQPSIRMKESIEQRRAARSFRSDPIPEAILIEILRLGLRAPSGYNLQPWRFILLQDPDNKATLRTCAFDQRQVTEAPVVLICCGESPSPFGAAAPTETLAPKRLRLTLREATLRVPTCRPLAAKRERQVRQLDYYQETYGQAFQL